MFPITYGHRDGNVFYDVVFTDNWGPFREGDHYNAISFDLVDQRILARKGMHWQPGVPFQIVHGRGIHVQSAGGVPERGVLGKCYQVLRRKFLSCLGSI